MPITPTLENWTCPLPLRDSPIILLGHGGGGKLTADLVEHIMLPAFQNPQLAELGDSAVLDLPPGRRWAFTSDAHVVHPLFFPGGSIGHLAAYGTVNDLAMMGARPLHLTAAFILEEGLSLVDLARIVHDLAAAAQVSGVTVVAGDTKVVERGRGHGCYITTSGIGLISEGRAPGPAKAQPGDAILISGSLGDHGSAILSVREGLTFETPIQSDAAPLHDLVEAIYEITPHVHCLRDPTRGGLAAALNEIAARSHVGMVIDEHALPIRPEVQSACELFGLDPLLVPNEGKLIAILPETHAHAVLNRIRSHPLGTRAAHIGRVVADHPGLVVCQTSFGTQRIVPMPIGEQLPRIC
jgi:hydrogenase expression/formation protein HypE